MRGQEIRALPLVTGILCQLTWRQSNLDTVFGSTFEWAWEISHIQKDLKKVFPFKYGIPAVKFQGKG